MKVYELLNDIKNNPNYIENSLITHSFDIAGAVFKFLIKVDGNIANKKKIFVVFDENEYYIDLYNKTVVDWYYINE